MNRMNENEMFTDPWSVKEYLDNQKNQSRNLRPEDIYQDDLTIFATKENDSYERRKERY